MLMNRPSPNPGALTRHPAATSRGKQAARALVMLACCLPAACSEFADVEPAKPTSLRAALAAMDGGLPESAMSVSQRHLDTNPDDFGAVLVQGKALTEMGRLTEAQARFERAIELRPSSAGAQYGLGRVHLLAGRYAEAQTAFESCLALLPGDARTLSNLGIAMDLQGHHAEAQRAYEAALAADPESDVARINLGLSLTLSGDPTRAVTLLRPLASPVAPARVRQDLALALTMTGDRAGAETMLRQDLPAEQVAGAMEGLNAMRPAADAPAAAK